MPFLPSKQQRQNTEGNIQHSDVTKNSYLLKNSFWTEWFERWAVHNCSRLCRQIESKSLTFDIHRVVMYDKTRYDRLHCVPNKTSTFYFLNNSVKNQPILMIFWHDKSWENLTRKSYRFVHVARCSHFTLGNPKKLLSTVLFIHPSDFTCQKSLKIKPVTGNFWQSYSKNKKWTFLGGHSVV